MKLFNISLLIILSGILLLCIACPDLGPTSPNYKTNTPDSTTPTPSPRPNPNYDIKFIDTDVTSAEIGGRILIPSTPAESSVSYYNIYWGDNATTRHVGGFIGSISADITDRYFVLPANTAIPGGVKYLLLYPFDYYTVTERTDPADIRAVAIQDLVVIMVADINPGAPSSNPQSMCLFNTFIYFQATNTLEGCDLFSYNGSSFSLVGANGVNAGAADGNPEHLIAFNNKLYFSGYSDAGGTELWSCTGGGGLAQVDDINIGTGSSNPDFLTLYTDSDGSKLFFQANNGTDCELFSMNTGEIVAMATNIYTGPGNSGTPQYLSACDNSLFFVASDNATGTKLMYYNFNKSITTPVTNQTDPRYLTVCNNALYFQASNPTFGYEGWKFTVAGGVVSMGDIIYPNAGNGAPEYFTYFNGLIWFAATSASAGRELWSSDFKTFDLNPVTSSNPSNLYAYNGKLFFQATDGFGDMELWVYDPVYGQPEWVDLNPGTPGSFPDNFIFYNSNLYFAADSGDGSGKELQRLSYNLL